MSPWLKVHDDLPRHPKTTRLCRRLGADRNIVVGSLVCLWSWAFTYAEDGDLKKFTDEDIADAAHWSGDAGEFVKGLKQCGWLDGKMIHDWDEYAGPYIRERNRSRFRKQNPCKTDMVPRPGRGEAAAKSKSKREKDLKSSLPPKVSAARPEEWQARADAVLSQTRYPQLYRDMATLLAEENRTGKVAISRVVRELYEPLLAAENNGTGHTAFEYGMRQALAKGAPNVNYVKKAAQNAPAGYAPRSSAEDDW